MIRKSTGSRITLRGLALLMVPLMCVGAIAYTAQFTATSNTGAIWSGDILQSITGPNHTYGQNGNSVWNQTAWQLWQRGTDLHGPRSTGGGDVQANSQRITMTPSGDPPGTYTVGGAVTWTPTGSAGCSVACGSTFSGNYALNLQYFYVRGQVGSPPSTTPPTGTLATRTSSVWTHPQPGHTFDVMDPTPFSTAVGPLTFSQPPYVIAEAGNSTYGSWSGYNPADPPPPGCTPMHSVNATFTQTTRVDVAVSFTP